MSTQESKPSEGIKKLNFFNIDRAIENVKNIKTPIQLAAFVLLLIIVVVLYSKSITINFLLFFVFTLPFFLIFLLFSEKSITFFKSYRKAGLRVLIILIGIALLFAIIPLYFVFANPALIGSSNDLPFSKEFALSKAQKVRKNENLIQNYSENYVQLSNFFFSKLNTIITDSNLTSSQDVYVELQNKLQEISAKISKLKGENTYSIYGDNETQELISKLQSSITSLYFSKYIFGIIYSCYSSQKMYSIDEVIHLDKAYFDSTIIATTTSKISNITDDDSSPQISLYRDENEWTKLHGVQFSEIESKIIHELGRDIVLKKIKDINVDDVQRIKVAFKRIGIGDSTSFNTPNQAILDNFLKELSKYVDPNTFEVRFYQLAYSDLQNQLSIYLSMHKTGLIDFNKFILSMCPTKAKSIFRKVLHQKLELFNFQDVKRLKNSVEKKLMDKKSQKYSQYLLDDVVSNYLNKFSEKNVQSIIQSESIEEYVTEALKWECLKKGTNSLFSFPSQTFFARNLKFTENTLDNSESSTDLFNSYKRILLALNLIESNLLTEVEE